jgi:NitT/TauT family transport system permease protein
MNADSELSVAGHLDRSSIAASSMVDSFQSGAAISVVAPTSPDGAAGPGSALRLVLLAAKGCTGFAVLIGIWIAVASSGVLAGPLAVQPWQVASTLGRQVWSGALASAALSTIEAWAFGLAICVVVGILIGVLTGRYSWPDAGSSLIINFMRPIPSVALVPVVVAFLGTELKTQVLLIVLATVWPVIFNTRYGVHNVDGQWLDEAVVLGAGSAERLWRVVLPGAFPQILAGIRTASSMAVVVAVAAELVVGSPGLGYYVAQMQQVGNYSSAYAGIVLAGLFGYVANELIKMVERRTVAWHVRGTEGSE